MIKYTFPLKLPSLNDYVNKCRTHKQAGASFKRKIQEDICWSIKQQGVKKTKKKVDVKVIFHEANKMRDKDNVISSIKYLMDSLVVMKVIPDDNWQYINQYDFKVVTSKDKKYLVELELHELD